VKVIIAGSRTISDLRFIEEAVIESNWINSISEVVCGCADGVDKLGYLWWKQMYAYLPHNLSICFFPAWEKQRVWAESVCRAQDRIYFKREDSLDKSAGYKRNIKMAHYADKLLAVTVGSPGTEHMIQTMRGLNKPVSVLNVYGRS
jgi:hypothetical protein